MKTIARILIRPGVEAGLFIPMRDNPLEPGLYNLNEVCGETVLVFVGEPAMDRRHMSGRSPGDLLASRETALMTTEESKIFFS